MEIENKIFVTRSSLPPFEEFISEIEGIWDNHWLTNMGPLHQKFKEHLKKHLDVEQLELFTNGHMALELTLRAFDLKGEVITTPYTFASTTHAIVRSGLTPVFCDINKDDFTIDVTKIEDLITEKTSAIVPVHVYGNMCDVDQIDKIAKKYNLKVIYDAAHAFNVSYKGKSSATFGDASMFSFHATKVFNSIEGGAVAFKKTGLGKILRGLKNFGIEDEEHVERVGVNAKMNEFQAAMGICNLRHLKEEIDKRKILVEYYNRELEEVEGIKILSQQKDVESNYAYYPILIDNKEFGVDRNVVCENLKRLGIYTRKYFYPLTNTYACYKKYNKMSSTPIAQKISEQILTLPLYSDLAISDVKRICKLIKVSQKGCDV